MSSTEQAKSKQLNYWLKSQKKSAQGKLSRAIALGSINGLLMIVQTAMLAYLIDLVIFTDSSITNGIANDTTNNITKVAIALVAVIFSRAALGYFSECYSRRGAMFIKTNIRSKLLNRLFELGPAYTQKKGTAKISHLLHQGVDSLEDY